MGIKKHNYCLSIFKNLETQKKLSRIDKLKLQIDKLMHPSKYVCYTYVDLGTFTMRK